MPPGRLRPDLRRRCNLRLPRSLHRQRQNRSLQNRTRVARVPVRASEEVQSLDLRNANSSAFTSSGETVNGEIDAGMSIRWVMMANLSPLRPRSLRDHYRPTGRKSRPLITLSIFLKFGVAMSIGMYCLTYRAAENARLLSKQLVCLKILSNTHEDIFQPQTVRDPPTHLSCHHERLHWVLCLLKINVIGKTP